MTLRHFFSYVRLYHPFKYSGTVLPQFPNLAAVDGSSVSIDLSQAMTVSSTGARCDFSKDGFVGIGVKKKVGSKSNPYPSANVFGSMYERRPLGLGFCDGPQKEQKE
jgi:hypothetical protein